MSEPDPDRVQRRSDRLLPEEEAVGSEDAVAQAAAILDDSQARETYAEPTPDLRIDHRRSDETVDPGPA
jgi:hypothetical protein